MTLRVLVAAALLASGGCVIIYDVDDLRPRDASGGDDDDGAIPDAMIDTLLADVDPSMVTITAVSPAELLEGTGEGGSRPALLVVDGTNLADDAVISIEIGDGAIDAGVPDLGLLVGATAVGAGHVAAAAVTIPVLTNLDDGETVDAQVVITQAGGTARFPIVIKGLDQFEPTDDSVDSATLKPLYSRITIAEDVHIGGAKPALLRSTSDITLTARLDVDGQGNTPGAHGCAGGIDVNVAGCGDGAGIGGNSGLSGAAGGGGGFSGEGSPGAASQGNGTGGQVTGEPWLTQLTFDSTDAGNRGNGGGTGGGATLGTAGVGGGGGGVLELTAAGRIVIDGGTARAKGGDGTVGGGVGGGDGGGGSGGAIVVRAGAGITAGAWLSAPKGIGPDTGGDGSVGRIRIDSPTSIDGMASEPAARRGAFWAAEQPQIVRSQHVAVDVVGEPGATYSVRINDVNPGDDALGTSGTDRIAPPPLREGHNEFCVLVSLTASLARREGFTCIDIVYVPE